MVRLVLAAVSINGLMVLLCMRSRLTFVIDVIIKDGGILMSVRVWEIESELFVSGHEVLQFGSVLQFHKSSDAPHDGEDVEALQMLGRRPALFIVLLRNQALEQVAALTNHERFYDLHLEHEVLDGEAIDFWEGGFE